MEIQTYLLIFLCWSLIVILILLYKSWYKIGFGTILLFLFIVIGLTRAKQYGDQIQNNLLIGINKEKITSVLKIIDDPSISKSGKTYGFTAKLNINQSGSSLFSPQTKLKVNIAVDSLSEKLSSGSLITFSAYVNIVQKSNIPNAINYKNYLFRKGITHQLYISKDNWETVNDDQSFNLQKFANSYRNKLLHILQTCIKNDDAYSIASAILIGHREGMTDELMQSYRNAGAAHIIAVSGLHVGAIALLINWLLKFFKSNTLAIKILKLLIILISLCIYSILTGASPSVIRASIMFSLLFGGQLFYKSKNSWNNLAIVAFLLLLYNPMYIYDISFQFSFLAVSGILAFYPLINKVTEITNKLLSYPLKITLISLAAQFFLWPLSIYYFNTFPFGFLISNLLVIPAAAALIYCGIILFLCYYIYEPIGLLIGGVLNYGIVYLNKFILNINAFESLLISNIWISKSTLFMLYIFLLSIAAIHYKKSVLRLYLILLSTLIISANYCYTSIQQTKEKSLVIYLQNNDLCIDFYYKKHCYSYIPDPQLNLIKRNRIKKGVLNVIDLFSKEKYTDHYLRKDQNIIEFFSKSIIINPSNNIRNLSAFDIIILSENKTENQFNMTTSIKLRNEAGHTTNYNLKEEGPFIYKY